ncbi:hypothetical protein [Thermoflavimicrobium dichotomicum]|uniref:Uncharacterized protein n=1 Tax=Thermoflavimicrobium dichotomicum TaxID=46223 RepID=A0A1I3U4U3_9BACL|nr:hypothetical protein [Thermoflavimicrobium dichotomicum]SFJ76811.1 hypothetical protein SAMN05421852_12114 [Thermoflavimicrobium dichotomicum]
MKRKWFFISAIMTSLLLSGIDSCAALIESCSLDSSQIKDKARDFLSCKRKTEAPLIT